MPPPIELMGHDDFVYDVIFSPDGNFLASASWDRKINLWDVRAVTSDNPSIAPTTLTGHSGQVVKLAFNSDGQLLFSASLDGSIRVWNAEVDGFVLLACREVHRNLSWDEWKRYLEGDEYRLTCPDLPVHPTYIESALELAQRQDIEGAVARLENAIALGAELGFEPEAKARAEAGRGIINNGLRQAELGNIMAAQNAFVEAQELGESVEIRGEEWQQLCFLGNAWEETAVVLDACATAVDLSVNSDDIIFNQELCRMARTPSLTSTMLPACDRVVELAADTEDAYLAYQVCQLPNDIDGFSATVAPLCELAASQTQTITVRTSNEGFVAAGQGELWSFEGTEGQLVTIGLTAVADSLDTYLILIGPEGDVIAENDDIDPGVNVDSQLEGIALPATGIYTIVVRGFDEASLGAYTITLE